MADPVGFYELDGTVHWLGPKTVCKRWDAKAKEWRPADWRVRLRLLSENEDATGVRADLPARLGLPTAAGDITRIDATEVAGRGIPVAVPDTWRDHPKGEGDGGIGQAFWLTIPVGCLASLVVGIIVLVVFVLSGRSWLAAVGAILAGSLGGTVLGLLLALVLMAIFDLQTRVYLIWRTAWAFFVLALLVDVLCPPVVTVVVALLLA